MDFSKLGTAAAESDNMTVEKSFEREVPAEGVALIRFKDYIELGRHESSNPTYKPALKAILTFELHHPKHLIEIDGKKVPQTMQVRLNKGTTAKSGFRKLFNIMKDACGDDSIVHFVQMIGKPFLGRVYHNVVGEGKDKKIYANLDKDGAYSLVAPQQVDALTEKVTPVPVPELDGTPTVFLWENESISDEDVVTMWNSIFIEGTRTVEDPATKGTKEVSKNWIQETIMKNTEWEGSITQALTQEHVELDDLDGVAEGEGGDALLNALEGAASSDADDIPSLDD